MIYELKLINDSQLKICIPLGFDIEICKLFLYTILFSSKFFYLLLQINVALNLTNCSMSYAILSQKVFTSIEITFGCNNCQLFKWIKPSGSSFIIYINDNYIRLKIVDKTSGVEDTTGEGDIISNATTSESVIQIRR